MKVKWYADGIRGFCACMILLAGCSTVQPSEADNPLLDPQLESDSALDGAQNLLRRVPLERHVTAHHAELLAEIAGSEGSQLAHAYTLAGVPETERGVVTARLASDLALYGTSPEALVRALLIYGA